MPNFLLICDEEEGQPTSRLRRFQGIKCYTLMWPLDIQNYAKYTQRLKSAPRRFDAGPIAYFDASATQLAKLICRSDRGKVLMTDSS